MIAADEAIDHNLCSEAENIKVWIRLEANEIELILNSLPEGPLAQRLREQPHPETSLFADAVDANDNLEVDTDAVISRSDEGAFVMAWSWVSNEQAGVPNVRADEDEDEEINSGLKI